MNPIQHEANTFRPDSSNVQSEYSHENDVDELQNIPVDHGRDWDNTTEKSTAEDPQVLTLWESLHHDFCNYSNVIKYAATPLGQEFAHKYQNLMYVQDKFRDMKADFHKVAAEIRMAGSDGLPFQSRYQHLNEMKIITLGDPRLWPSNIIETDCVRNGSFVGPITGALRADGCFHEDVYLEELEAFKRMRLDQSFGPGPTPEPPMLQSDRKKLMDEATERLLSNSAKIGQDSMEGFSRMLEEFGKMRGLVAQAAKDMRRRDLAASEERRLDRLAWEKIAENDLKMREIEMKRRERIAELELLSRQTSSRSSSSTNNTN